MVDAELHRNILLAVAAKKQNERTLATAAEKLEQHIEQIGNSNERIVQGERIVRILCPGLIRKNLSTTVPVVTTYSKTRYIVLRKEEKKLL